MDRRLALEELARRKELRQQADGVAGEILGELFDKQRRFADSPSRNLAVIGSRRAGKTDMWPRIATAKALIRPRSLVRVWSHARARTKELLWQRFQYLLGRQGIKHKPHEVELSFKFENGSEVRLVGADKDKEVQKKRGDSTWVEIVLESQNFGSLLKPLVEDVIRPSLIDTRGTVYLEGTPGPICTGYWWDITGGEDVAQVWQSKGPKDVSMFEVHRWTMLDNPYIPHAREELEEIKTAKGWTDDNPTYLREWLGRWVNDVGALYYAFDTLRNTYDPRKVQPWGRGWSHVLGWDLGGKDDMALVCWGWHEDDPTLYEVFSWKQSGALSHEVMSVIEQHEKEKGLQFVKQVADTQGGGRAYVDDVMNRYTRPFEAAQKGGKYAHVMLLNDDLRTGKVKVRPGSPLQEELAGLMRDPDWPNSNDPDAPPTEDPSCPNHCADAGLYAHRAAFHFLPREVKPKRVGPHQADAYEEQALKELTKGRKPWYEDEQESRNDDW
jgi:hypothetical protein